MSFSSPRSDLFFSKNNKMDPRLGDLVNSKASRENLTVILGYPDDEGIKLNGGRPGAKDAPDTIRKYFYKMTPPLFSKIPNLQDGGNLKIQNALSENHEIAKNEVVKYLKQNAKVIALGGGNDYAYADGAAFLKQAHKVKPLIINFDAHLDVRETDKGFHSGTPFRRLLEEFEDFDFLEVGIQSQCNSRHHYEWAKERGAHILAWDDVMRSGQSPTLSLLKFLDPFLLKPRPAYIAIDIDGFSSNFAPGCSQSFATGFSPEDFFRVLEILLHRTQTQVLGIYEVSPTLDQDDRTSKLAALIMHRFISHCP